MECFPTLEAPTPPQQDMVQFPVLPMAPSELRDSTISGFN
jgi:hypothetical protein